MGDATQVYRIAQAGGSTTTAPRDTPRQKRRSRQYQLPTEIDTLILLAVDLAITGEHTSTVVFRTKHAVST